MDSDVIVVGAGLAGLRCAIRLAELGREVMVVDAADTVGGRLRTDVVDGFQCPASRLGCADPGLNGTLIRRFRRGVEAHGGTRPEG